MALEQTHELKILFLPMMAPGHMIPMLDVINLVINRTTTAIKATILTTTNEAAGIRIATSNISAYIDLHLVSFPTEGQPGNLSSLPTPDSQLSFIFHTLPTLRPSFEDAIRGIRPDVIVSDMFFPWTIDTASELGVPRVSFHGKSVFGHCVEYSCYSAGLFDDGDCLTVVFDDLPDKIEMYKSQFMDFTRMPVELVELIKAISDADRRSYGLVANSFYGLEPKYIEYYKDRIGKTWCVGPVHLCSKETKADDDRSSCLRWLDSKEQGSVVYICFGSTVLLNRGQMTEIATGLVKSRRDFLWVVKNGGDSPEDLMPEEMKKVLIDGKGRIETGWVQQRLILSNSAVGGFMTHCGWNSTIESISSGVPMITWPLSADQFMHEKLIVDVLKIGVSVGNKQYRMVAEEGDVVAGKVTEAIERVMGEGDEGLSIRKRAMELKEMAVAAMEEGGSSYVDVGLFVEELMNTKKGKFRGGSVN